VFVISEPNSAASKHDTLIALFTTALFGTFWFVSLGLWPFVNPTHIDWMIEGDWMGHLFGWLFVRSGPWSIPLAQAPQLVAPFGSSAALTDAIPLLSVIAKIFSPFFGPRFQPFGLWMLLGVMGTGFAGVLSMRAHFKDWFSLSLIGALFVVNPIVSTRYGHPPFFGMWSLVGLVGASLWPVSGAVSGRKLVKSTLLLLFLGCATNAYLAVMASGVAFAVVLRVALVDRKIPLNESLLWLCATPIVSLGTLSLFGFVSGLNSSSMESLAIEGFGQFSADLLTFVNPADWSRFLSPIAMGPRQYEGWAYLGLGVIALSLISAFQFVRIRPGLKTWAFFAPILVVALAMCFYALSNIATIRGQMIADFSSLYAHAGKWPSVFRSSGRFVWPMHALIGLTGVLAVSKFKSIVTRRAVLGFAALLQFADFNPGHMPFHTPREPAVFSPFKDPAWQLMSQGYKDIIMHPIQIQWTCGFDGPLVAKLSWEAYLHNLTINSGHVGRPPPGTDCNRHLAPSELKSDAVYIAYFPQWHSDFLNAGFICAPLEGTTVCVDSKNETPLKRLLQSRL
jgi:Family of unknown function (DUF6311)